MDRKHRKAGKSTKIDYLVCDNLETLIYAVDLGCIDLNPWNSSIQHPLKPDYMVVDIDPTDNDFLKVVEVARAARSVLKKLRLTSFPKTSGKTGLHIFLPVSPAFTFSQSRLIISRICESIRELVPDLATTEDTISRRGEKVFLDDNQNDLADTLASAYCVRPYHRPNISTPLSWSEVNRRLDPDNFNIKTVPGRIAKKGDLFSGIFDGPKGKANSQVMKKLL